LEKTGKPGKYRRMNPKAPEVGFYMDSTPSILVFLSLFESRSSEPAAHENVR
jgi:hypothetical protein